MPVRAPSICGHCGGVHPSGVRCPKAVAMDRERKARFDARRPTARARGYDSEWRHDRAVFLQAHPHCRRCGEPATVVDHIKAHKGDVRLFRDKSNWQALCASCHNGWKQSQERKG